VAGWDRNADWNRDVLERIVALLFALANLADLAAGAPFLRRRRVLEILSYGEAEARAFVMGVAFGETARRMRWSPPATRRAWRQVSARWRLRCAPCWRGPGSPPSSTPPVRGPAGRRTSFPVRRFTGRAPGRRPGRIRGNPAREKHSLDNGQTGENPGVAMMSPARSARSL
jgi:hypothetical protein